MKGSVLAALPLVPLVALASACAGAPHPRPMPAWAPDPEGAGVVAASAPLDIDDDEMRVPRVEETPEIWPARGLYIGGALITSQPMGDFDGDKFYTSDTDHVLIPDIDLGAGAGIYVSYRWYMNELMLQYSITEHDGEFDGSPRDHDTTFYDLDFNWRHYFWAQSPLQPYGLLGIGWSRAEIDNGSLVRDDTMPFFTGPFADAELENGINFNVGAGAALYTLPWVVFYGQAMYRFVRYETSDGIAGNLSNTPDVDGDGWNVSFGAALRVLPPRN